MWALSEETLRAEATRVFTETGGSAAAIKLSIIQLDSQSDEELGGGKMQANSDGSPFGKTLSIQAFNQTSQNKVALLKETGKGNGSG